MPTRIVHRLQAILQWRIRRIRISILRISRVHIPYVALEIRRRALLILESAKRKRDAIVGLGKFVDATSIGLFLTLIYVAAVIYLLRGKDLTAITLEQSAALITGIFTPPTLFWLVIGYLMQSAQMKIMLNSHQAQYSALMASTKSDTLSYLLSLHDRTLPKAFDQIKLVLLFLNENALMDIDRSLMEAPYTPANVELLYSKCSPEEGGFTRGIELLALSVGNTLFVNAMKEFVDLVEFVEQAIHQEGPPYRHVLSSQYQMLADVARQVKECLDRVDPLDSI